MTFYFYSFFLENENVVMSFVAECQKNASWNKPMAKCISKSMLTLELGNLCQYLFIQDRFYKENDRYASMRSSFSCLLTTPFLVKVLWVFASWKNFQFLPFFKISERHWWLYLTKEVWWGGHWTHWLLVFKTSLHLLYCCSCWLRPACGHRQRRHCVPHGAWEDNLQCCHSVPVCSPLLHHEGWQQR